MSTKTSSLVGRATHFLTLGSRYGSIFAHSLAFESRCLVKELVFETSDKVGGGLAGDGGEP